MGSNRLQSRPPLHVRRLKGGTASVHPIQGDELRALRELRRQTEGAYVFASERGGPMTRFNVSKMVEAAGERARLPYARPYMLRHTCGCSRMPGTTRGGFSYGLVTWTLNTRRITAN